MNNTDYHAHPAIGASGLLLIDDAPAKYWEKYINPDREPEKESPAKKKGRVIHSACLEPHLFDERYAVMPDGLTRQSKEGRNLYAELIGNGKEVISNDDLNDALRINKAFNNNPFIQNIRKFNPIIEKSFFIKDEKRGIQIKIKPDIWIEPCSEYPNGKVIDPKSTESASPKAFGKSVWNYKYYVQAYLYPKVLQQIYKTKEPPPFSWYAQEKDAPYLSAVYDNTAELVAWGEQETERLLDIASECFKTNKWLGYDVSPSPVELPQWALREITASEGEIEVSYVK